MLTKYPVHWDGCKAKCKDKAIHPNLKVTILPWFFIFLHRKSLSAHFVLEVSLRGKIELWPSEESPGGDWYFWEHYGWELYLIMSFMEIIKWWGWLYLKSWIIYPKEDLAFYPHQTLTKIEITHFVSKFNVGCLLLNQYFICFHFYCWP